MDGGLFQMHLILKVLLVFFLQFFFSGDSERWNGVNKTYSTKTITDKTNGRCKLKVENVFFPILDTKNSFLL